MKEKPVVKEEKEEKETDGEEVADLQFKDGQDLIQSFTCPIT